MRVAFGRTPIPRVGARRRRVSGNAQVRLFKGVYCFRARFSIVSDAAITEFAARRAGRQVSSVPTALRPEPGTGVRGPIRTKAFVEFHAARFHMA
jgi:hypothetical protein